MLASPETRELIRTQRMDYKANTGEQVFELYPMEYGKGRIHVTVTCGGSCEEDLREDYASLGIKALRKRWKDYLKDQFHTQASPRLGIQPRRWTSPSRSASRPRCPTRGSASSTRPRPRSRSSRTASSSGCRACFAAWKRRRRTVRPAMPADRTSDERKGPLLLPEPHIRQLQYRIHLPAGFTPKALPESSLKQHGPATISQKYEMSGDDVIVATFRLDTGPGRFTAEEVEDLRQAIAELAKDENSPWEVKIGLENVAARDMAAGRVAEALAQARTELARRPSMAAPRRPALALLAAAVEGRAGRSGPGRGPPGGRACAALGRGLCQSGPHAHLRPVGPPFPPRHGLGRRGRGLRQGIGA